MRVGVIAASKKPKPVVTLNDRVRELYDSGCPLDEVLLPFPSDSTAKLTAICRAFEPEREEE